MFFRFLSFPSLSIGLVFSCVSCPGYPAQRQIVRDRRPSTAACPARWAMVTKGIGIVFGVLGRLEPPRQNKKLVYRHGKPNEPTRGRTPFIGTLWVPIHLSFNSQQGPPLSDPTMLVVEFPAVMWCPFSPVLPALSKLFYYLIGTVFSAIVVNSWQSKHHSLLSVLSLLSQRFCSVLAFSTFLFCPCFLNMSVLSLLSQSVYSILACWTFLFCPCFLNVSFLSLLLNMSVLSLLSQRFYSVLAISMFYSVLAILKCLFSSFFQIRTRRITFLTTLYPTQTYSHASGAIILLNAPYIFIIPISLANVIGVLLSYFGSYKYIL